MTDRAAAPSSSSSHTYTVAAPQQGASTFTRHIVILCYIMLYDAITAEEMAAKMLEEGIYVIGFYFPVVPKGKARIRVQISAAINERQLDEAIHAFTKVGNEMGIISS